MGRKAKAGRLRTALTRFRTDRRGVSAVEFALLAPMMIAIYLGCVEVSDGVGVQRKVSLVSAALANLSAQVTTISASEMDNILDASSAIVAPYSDAKLKLTIACLNIDANRRVTVKWSASRNGNAETPADIPAALKVANTQLIYAKATYDYKPTVGDAITGTLTLNDRMYMSPRISAPSYDGRACT